ncbi:glycoside hydrolase family 16 protein [Deinococcus sp. SM5_A1]|uniref:glycoside hydrolase family 16 protein n=1 Tax=Deinococcus sp. SM5_A1 TaxID=3379094 RepID=UPI00385DFEAD
MYTHLRFASTLLILTAALSACSGSSPVSPPSPPENAPGPIASAPSQPEPTAPPIASGPAGLWTETFDRLDLARWIPSSQGGFWQHPGLTGTFQADNAYVDGKGHLVLALKVQSCGAGLCAQAAEIQSAQRFGFGRYTYRMRAASTSANPTEVGRVPSGNVTAAFSYMDNGTSEIDIEIEGNHPETLHAVVWKGRTQKSYAPISTGTTLGQGFHTYSYEWRPDRITYFLDGARVWETTQNIPQDPAHIMFNIWPTISDGWGGQATIGTVYMLVDSVAFEPLP